MKIGWYTHHLVTNEKTSQNGSTGLFDGKFAGGAEMSDWEYASNAPHGIDIYQMDGATWHDPSEFDSIVVTGTESFSDAQLTELAKHDPFVFVHHLQTPRPSLELLINNSRMFVTHTPAHMMRELAWTKPKRTGQVLSYFDTSEIWPPQDKDYLALWAARRHPLKGEMAALNWAMKMEVPFLAMSNHERRDVLQAMAYAEYFVHLPLAFESECRAVMEAVLSGCKVVTNQNVGITSVQDWEEPEVLKNMIDKAGETFWRLVLA